MKTAMVTVLAMVVAASSAAAEAIAVDALTVPGVAYETYLVRWWGAPGSELGRPIYRMARFDTDAVQVHYGIVPGRDLADYTMPYWPIRSFLSVVDPPAELAQQISLSYRNAAGGHSVGFTPRSGVELAVKDNGLLVKFRNRSLATPEDVTAAQDAAYQETNPLALEQVLVLRKDSRNVPVQCTLTNVGDADLSEVTVVFIFEQSFCWTRFGAAPEDAYATLRAPASGAAQAFYAWSEGMERGYAIAAGAGTQLTYELLPDMNRWRAQLCCPIGGFKAGAEKVFGFELRALPTVPKRVERPMAARELSELSFVRLQPATFRTAPVVPEDRVALAGVIENLDRPKVRGMNLRAGLPQALEDLETLKDWGCNLVITGLGNFEHTAELIARGHALGLEMLLAGRGAYREGPPDFDAYYASPRTPEQLPDAHGQDEDHYYWDSIAPERTFKTGTGKPMPQATHDEMVAYWARCFADKWRGVREDVRRYAPGAGIWFYAPFPGVAHVDPIDRYRGFMHTLSQELGEDWTVFPFYYGIEYNQVEYMMARWKEAGATRAVFLPMRDFMTLPSQFIRAITAARRGGADGACGFSFSVGDAPPDKQWQWKAVMLAACANFPTPNLDAYCLIEEPAELVESLAKPDVVLRAVSETEGLDPQACLATLHETLPHAKPSASQPTDNALTILLTDKPSEKTNTGLPPVPSVLWTTHKGIVQMSGTTVRLAGADTMALQNACKLLLRFAKVARDENLRGLPE